MKDSPAILTLRIETEEPIELGSFVGAFTSLAEEYRRYAIDTGLPDDEAKVFVKEVRKGSIIADLMPLANTFLMAADAATYVQTLEDFTRRWGGRIEALISGRFPDPETKINAKHWLNAVEAIANDPHGSASLATTSYENGKTEERIAFQFDTSQAKEAQKTIEGVYKRLEEKQHADHSRVLMVFTRTDVGNAKIGKPSGERVKIEEISDRALALTYASELSEQRIKHEIQQSPDNIYKKGFVVDVNVQTRNENPVAYSVVDVHEIVELPDDAE